MTAPEPPFGAAVDRWLARFPAEDPPAASAEAAVTIVLRPEEEDVGTLLIERTVRARDPASGQVALPGGHVDPEDPSLAGTALRELEEEVGLGIADLAGPPRYVRTLLAQRFGLRVGVFAAALGPTPRRAFPGDPDEVAHVFWLPRRALEETRRVVYETSRGPLEVPATVFEGHVLWGFTRRVLREFFGLPIEEIGAPGLPPTGADADERGRPPSPRNSGPSPL
ncbi:NUDIX hydrolase [mine drainage metagenome]|uniref:NUDIX hydrolase n=1 Tax=mine drainage metagenome TaxID=410659 RepID=T0Z6D6_9ZZZZ